MKLIYMHNIYIQLNRDKYDVSNHILRTNMKK